MITPEQITEGAFLLFNKPKYWTSHDVVAKVRKVLVTYCKTKNLKVGHAGTLDPLATGLLILATGKFTKQIDQVIQTHKTYEGIFHLGATTPTFDLESEVDQTFNIETITDKMIYEVAEKFKGKISQMPPIHSAIKQNGKPVYLSAREGKEVKLDLRNVEILRFEILKIMLPEIHILVECSKGTYIRSLAHDFGKALNNGAYLQQLTRTKVGAYDLVNASELNIFLASIEKEIDKQNASL